MIAVPNKAAPGATDPAQPSARDGGWRGAWRERRPSANAAMLGPRGLWWVSPTFRIGLFAVLICAAAGAASIAMGPDNNWDLRYYHLYAPWAYLHGRYLYDIAPAQSQGFFNPMADLLFYALATSRLNEAPRVVAFIMGAVHGINAALMLAIAVRVLRPDRPLERGLLCAAAFLIGVSGAGFVSLLGTTTNDLVNAIFVLASLLGLLALGEHGGSVWRFAWPGALAGVGLGLKFTAAIFMPGLGLVAVVIGMRRRTAFAPLAFAGAALLAFLAVAGHHLLTLWAEFRNPVFPWLNDVFRSPYYEPVALRDDRFVARDFLQLFAYPFYWAKTNIYLVTELTFRDWRGAIAYAAAAAAVLSWAAGAVRGGTRRSHIPADAPGLGPLLLFVTVSYLLWAELFGIYRYAVVLEMLTGIVAVGCVMRVCRDGRVRIAASLLLLAAAAATTIYPDWGRGEHPSAGIRPAHFGDAYVDVWVPPLPANSLVLIATADPVAYFIPFAEPTARYLGIDNNLLSLAQGNRLVAEIKRLMRTPGPAKFVLGVDAPDTGGLDHLLAPFDLAADPSSCRRIRSNLEEHVLSLCRIAAPGDGGRQQ
jgi:hypothetical protein